MLRKQKLWFASLIAVCLLATTACVESKHALSDPQTSPQAPELFGAWKTTNPSGDATYVHIGGGVEVAVDPAQATPEAGLMHFYVISHSNSAIPQQPSALRMTKPFGMRFFVTEIDGNHYATCVPDPAPNKPPAKPEGYFFVKYRVDGDRLEVWDMNNEATAVAIEARKLGGTVEREAGQLKRVVITDSGEKIAQFLADGGDEQVFIDAGKTTYERLP